MVVGDELVEIPPVEWQSLQELFKVNWPANVVAFYTIQNYINWFKKEPNLPNIKIYSLNGDWSDGTYIIVVCDVVLWLNSVFQIKIIRSTGSISIICLHFGKIMFATEKRIRASRLEQGIICELLHGETSHCYRACDSGF